MKTLVFEGGSDDTFGEYGVTQDDRDNCGSGRPITCVVKTDRWQIRVVGQYLNGVWMVGVAPVEEDVKIPDWALRMSLADNGYSTKLEVDVPDSFELIWDE